MYAVTSQMRQVALPCLLTWRANPRCQCRLEHQLSSLRFILVFLSIETEAMLMSLIRPRPLISTSLSIRYSLSTHHSLLQAYSLIHLWRRYIKYKYTKYILNQCAPFVNMYWEPAEGGKIIAASYIIAMQVLWVWLLVQHGLPHSTPLRP
jgi:hypothetical protein